MKPIKRIDTCNKSLNEKPKPLREDSRARSSGIPENSITNQFRLLVKKKSQNRHVPVHSMRRLLDPLPETSYAPIKIHGPFEMQRLVDDFVVAAREGNSEKVNRYIRSGIPIDKNHSIMQLNPLHASTAVDDSNIAKQILYAGANVNAYTKSNDTPLHLAARYGATTVATDILRQQVDTDLTNKDGFTALQVAAEMHQDEMKKMLDRPSPPYDLQCQIITTTSVHIVWKCMNSDSTFNVEFSKLGSTYKWLQECCNPEIITDVLEPCTEYQITVQAGDRTTGWVDCPDPLLIKTLAAPPDVLSVPRILSVSNTTIQLELVLPHDKTSPITHLNIQFQLCGCLADISSHNFHTFTQPKLDEAVWQSILIDLGHRSHFIYQAQENDQQKFLQNIEVHQSKTVQYTVDDLLPGAIYFFRVKALNQIGWSLYSEPTDGICTNDIPAIVNVGSRSATLVWTKPYSLEEIDEYEIQSRTNAGDWSPIKNGHTSAQSMIISNLTPATTYCFRVIPHRVSKGWDCGDNSAVTPLVSTSPATPEAPVNFCALETTATSIFLSWTTPCSNGHIVLYYVIESSSCFINSGKNRLPLPCIIAGNNIHHCDDGCEWKIEAERVPMGMEKYEVTNLQRGTAYCFRVKAINSLGPSKHAYLSHPIQTVAILPPEAPICTLRTNFSLQIQWEYIMEKDLLDSLKEEWLERVENSVRFDVEMFRVDYSLHQYNSNKQFDIEDSERPWTLIASNILENNHCVRDLEPLGCYYFRVCVKLALPNTGEEIQSAFSAPSKMMQTLRRI